MPIPKSSNKNRLQENIDIFNFELSPEDVAAMKALNRNKRICDFIEYVEECYYFNSNYIQYLLNKLLVNMGASLLE